MSNQDRSGLPGGDSLDLKARVTFNCFAKQGEGRGEERPAPDVSQGEDFRDFDLHFPLLKQVGDLLHLWTTRLDENRNVPRAPNVLLCDPAPVAKMSLGPKACFDCSLPQLRQKWDI